MMYEKGLLEFVTPKCEEAKKDPDGFCYPFPEDDHVHYVYDSRGDNVPVFAPIVFLPHSCDQWVIGGPEQVRMMIADLGAALVKMKEMGGG